MFSPVCLWMKNGTNAQCIIFHVSEATTADVEWYPFISLSTMLSVGKSVANFETFNFSRFLVKRLCKEGYMVIKSINDVRAVNQVNTFYMSFTESYNTCRCLSIFKYPSINCPSSE